MHHIHRHADINFDCATIIQWTLRLAHTSLQLILSPACNHIFLKVYVIYDPDRDNLFLFFYYLCVE